MNESPATSDDTDGSPTGVIAVRGARTHNLQNVSVDIPRGIYVAVTGPSGSGKSSLVFDTLFAEGRRRFLETLSLSARRIAGELARPAVDSIRGLPPTVALGQAAGRPTKRSTVSTLAGIDEQLRVLFARLGQAHCPTCGQSLSSRTPSDIAERYTTMPERTKLILYAPLVRGVAGNHRERLEQILSEGFVRVRVDGTVMELTEVPPLDPDQQHNIDVVVDRLIVKSGFEQRFRESLDLAIEHGDGACVIAVVDSERTEVDHFENTRFACTACDVSYPDLDPRTLSFESPYGACESCRGLGIDDAGNGCSACDGERLGPFGRAVLLGGLTLPQLRRCTPADAQAWVKQLQADERQDDARAAVVGRVVPGLIRRLHAMDQLRLSHLTLDRAGRTLSFGETQRTRLVNTTASGLSGVLFVLDEPTAGLHRLDTEPLQELIKDLVGRGSSVVSVEHTPSLIATADRVIEFGPAGGSRGGRLVSVGDSVVQRSPEISPASPKPETTLRVINARLRTLKNVSVDIPLERFVGIAGVSGSGKSTFVRGVLEPTVRKMLASGKQCPDLVDQLSGVEHINAVSALDQTPAGRSHRSCPATILGAWGPVRTLLSRTKLARLRGFSASRFSFNSREGQCSRCRGRGIEEVRVRYLPPTTQTCPLCRGQRFEPETARVTWREKTVAELLDLTIDEALVEFANIDRVRRCLQIAADAGLGYLRLGQPARTLSGGESQRLKLVQTLTRSSAPRTLYLLDEPTIGLASSDIARLVSLLLTLTGSGHSVLCIEHNLDLLATCDHIIEFGPGPGESGGRITFEGPPAALLDDANSATAEAFRDALSAAR